MGKNERSGKRELRRPFVKPLLRKADDWSLRGKTAGWGGHHHHGGGGLGGGFTSAGPGGWGGADGGS